MQENRKIVKAAGLVSGATLLSRIAGLVRDQVTAYLFDRAITDAFFMAFRIPNLLRRLLAEGALTVTFVPVFTETLAIEGREAATDLFKRMFTLLTLVLLAVCALGVVFAPEIVKIMAPGYKVDPERFQLTVFLARVLFPYIFFMGLGALFMGALNATGHFTAPALGPFACNLAMIAGAFLLSPHLEVPVMGLAIGTLVGGALQVGIQIPALIKNGLPLKPCFHFRSPAIKKILILMGPATFGAAVYQLSVFINSILASLLPKGSVSWLYYADRLMQFPLGIFTMAISTAALPSLARQIAKGDQAGFISSARFALGLSFFITVPAMAGLVVLAHPLVTLLFQRGQFNPIDAQHTAEALWAFALGLPFLSGAAILARIFYSHSDTKTPTKAAAVSLVFGTIAAILLMQPFKHIGLALASSATGIFNFLWLYICLVRREPKFPKTKMFKELAGYFFMAMLMSAALWPLRFWTAVSGGGFWFLALQILIMVTAGIGLYIAMALIFKCPHVVPLMELGKRLFKRKPRGGEPVE